MPSLSTYSDTLRSRQNYLRNRDKRKREHRAYYLSHQADIKRKHRRYRRRVQSGATIQMSRARTGLGYQTLGVKVRPSKGTSTSVAQFIEQGRRF